MHRHMRRHEGAHCFTSNSCGARLARYSAGAAGCAPTTSADIAGGMKSSLNPRTPGGVFSRPAIGALSATAHHSPPAARAGFSAYGPGHEAGVHAREVLPMLTPEELRLANTVTTAEWRERYQPEGIRSPDHSCARSRRAQQATEFGSGVLAGPGENPCSQSLATQS